MLKIFAKPLPAARANTIKVGECFKYEGTIYLCVKDSAQVSTIVSLGMDVPNPSYILCVNLETCTLAAVHHNYMVQPMYAELHLSTKP